jgi:hypothetical protein
MVLCGYMAVRDKPTYKQGRFAKAYVEEAGNGPEAVIKAGYKVKSRKTASAISTENLSKPVVQHEIQSWQAKLEGMIQPALERVEDLSKSCPDPRVRLAANRDLLTRAGVGKQLQRTTNVLQVFSGMDEKALLAKMAEIANRKEAIVSEKHGDVSPKIDCATQDAPAPG